MELVDAICMQLGVDVRAFHDNSSFCVVHHDGEVLFREQMVRNGVVDMVLLAILKEISRACLPRPKNFEDLTSPRRALRL